MKTMMSRSWARGTCCVALVALVCVSQFSWGQNEVPRPTPQPEGQSSSGGSGSLGLLTGGQADDAFEQYASLKRLAAAWGGMDSALMTDAALQFAEGERVLLRSHKAIKASQILDLAIRMATENKDKESLSRIAKALEKSGDKDRLSQVNLSLKTASAARAVDPVLNEGNFDARSAIQAAQDEVKSARVAGSKPQLEVLEKSLADLPISDKQRESLKKSVADAREAIGEGKGVEKTVEQLDKLSGVVRSIGEIQEPGGNKPTALDFSSFKEPSSEELLEFSKLSSMLAANESSQTPPPILNPLEKLMSSSRAGWEYASSKTGGMPYIYAYVNQDGATKNNCGTAGIATMIETKMNGRLGKYGPNPVKTLENWGLGPDTPWQVFGTTKWRLESILSDKRVNYNCWWGEGNASLESYLRGGWPCLVLLDVNDEKAGYPNRYNTGKFGTGFHWTVVYAYDNQNYYCTNFSGGPKVPKFYFNKGWKNVVADGFWISNKFMLAWPK